MLIDKTSVKLIMQLINNCLLYVCSVQCQLYILQLLGSLIFTFEDKFFINS